MSKKAEWSMKHSWTQPYQGMNCREVYDTLGLDPLIELLSPCLPILMQNVS